MTHRFPLVPTGSRNHGSTPRLRTGSRFPLPKGTGNRSRVLKRTHQHPHRFPKSGTTPRPPILDRRTPNRHSETPMPRHHRITIDINWPDDTPVAVENVAPEVVASCIGLAAHTADTALAGLGIPTTITVTRSDDPGPEHHPHEA